MPPEGERGKCGQVRGSHFGADGVPWSKFWKLAKGQDLLQAIKDGAREHDIKAGVVIDITGSVTKARVQKFKNKSHDATSRIEVIEIEGPLELATGSSAPPRDRAASANTRTASPTCTFTWSSPRPRRRSAAT